MPTDNKQLKASLSKFFWKLYRGWGMLFRLLFIASIGFLGYEWIGDGPSVVDTPFSQLTLGNIIRGLLRMGIPLGCLGWFFNFPDNNPDDKENPYCTWASGSLFLIGILFFIWFLVYR